MALDGLLLYKITNELKELTTGRIKEIYDFNEQTFILQIRVNKNNKNLLISLIPTEKRIHITTRNYNKSLYNSNFTLLLKKNISGYIITDIKTHLSDRIVIISLSGLSEMKDKQNKKLIIELFSKHSNIILTNESNIIIDSLYHMPPSNENNIVILPNIKYDFSNEKLNIFDKNNNELITQIIKNNKDDLKKKFYGISNNFLKLVNENNIFKILNENIPCINKENDYYFFSNDIIKKFNSYSELLDEFYYQKSLKNLIKNNTNNISKVINNNITKYKNKLEKLYQELNETNNATTYKIKGELLLTYKNLKEKRKQIEIYNYYANQNEIINLDDKYTVLENSNLFYKKYKKLKNGVLYINDQINNTKKELEYFILLNEQLNFMNLKDALELQDELEKYSYIKQNKNKQIKNKKNLPNYKEINFEDTKIIYGKNNIQNEYILWNKAKKDYLWFHVKDGSGSHVIVCKDDNYSDELIRYAANIAASLSTQKNSSSVCINYTKVKNIKKIPGMRSCFVSISNEKSIYIDPSYIEK